MYNTQSNNNDTRFLEQVKSYIEKCKKKAYHIRKGTAIITTTTPERYKIPVDRLDLCVLTYIPEENILEDDVEPNKE